jgi:hypothetical protein
MSNIERKHEVLKRALDERLLEQRAAEGWRPVGVVWERTTEAEVEVGEPQSVPYGLRVSSDCQTLEPAAEEIRTMIHMLRMIVEEASFADIASSLNDEGFRTRAGAEWNQTMVFHMLPRLIEVAPNIYSSDAWQALRPRTAGSG